MTTETSSLSAIRRVLLALGSSDVAAGVVDLGAALASALQAEIAGLFIEEDLLYELSDFPTIGSDGRIAQKPDPILISHALSAQAQACRRALSTRAESSRLRWSFELQRGEALQVISTSANPSDVLVVSGTVGAITPLAKLEIAARLIDTAGAVLVVPGRLRIRGPIATVADSDAHFIRLAARLASDMGEQLVILANEGKTATGVHMVETVRTKFVRLRTADPAEASNLLMALKPRLVISNYHSFSDPPTAASLMQAAGAPLLLFGPALGRIDSRGPSPQIDQATRLVGD